MAESRTAYLITMPAARALQKQFICVPKRTFAAVAAAMSPGLPWCTAVYTVFIAWLLTPDLPLPQAANDLHLLELLRHSYNTTVPGDDLAAQALQSAPGPASWHQQLQLPQPRSWQQESTGVRASAGIM